MFLMMGEKNKKAIFFILIIEIVLHDPHFNAKLTISTKYICNFHNFSNKPFLKYKDITAKLRQPNTAFRQSL